MGLGWVSSVDIVRLISALNSTGPENSSGLVPMGTASNRCFLVEIKMSWQSSFSPQLEAPEALSSAFSLHTLHGLATPASYAVVAALDFGRIASGEFLAAMKSMAERTGSPQLLVAAIEPDPIAYYYRNFGAVPAFNTDAATTCESYLQDLNWDPDGGGADSIASHAAKVVVLSDDISWIILGERRFELARLFVRRDLRSLNLQDCLPAEWRYDQTDLLECLLDAGLPDEMARIAADQLE